MKNGNLIPLVLSLLAGETVHAATLHVPGTHPTLDAAVAAAAAGDVIVVQGGVHPPVEIGVPLSLIGDPQFTIDNSSVFGAVPAVEPAVLLAGPGHGRVSISRMTTSGQADVFQFVGGQPLRVEAAIAGGGFDELLVLDSTLEPCQWAVVDGGWEDGAPAIDVTVPDVLVARTSVIGGHAILTTCATGAPNVPTAVAAPGIRAPGSTVVVLDSDVAGGNGAAWCFGQLGAPCPSLPHPNVTGGAAGIVADLLLTAGSTLSGGAGSDVFCWPSSIIGAVPAGPAHVAGQVETLSGSFSAPGPIELGGTWSLDWAPADGYGVLFVAPPTPPTAAGPGWAFVDVGALAVVPIGGVTPPLGVPVPNQAALIGVEVAAQLYGAGAPLSRPFVGQVLP